MKRFEKGKFLAFTLAEVLITLGIIGIVASITIPTLMNNINEEEFNSGLKKIYSELCQAIQLIQQQNGTVDVGKGSTIADSNMMRDNFSSVMKFTKSDVAENIFLKSLKLYKGNDAGWSGALATGEPAAVLSDGTSLHFASYSSCSTITGPLIVCGQIRVDINGNKAPNMYGKDVYMFWVALNNGTYFIAPMGSHDDGLSCIVSPSNTTNSYGCTNKRLTSPTNMP